MPRGPLGATGTPTLHIYRHLLREASYLPPTCQAYARAQIRDRFRRHHHDPRQSPRTKARIRRARHDLRYLWAANNGLMSNMTRILLLAFGRIGRRRRELLQVVVTRGPGAADSDELERQIAAEMDAASDPGSQNRKQLPHDWLDEWDLPKFHALVASQAKQNFWSPKPDLKGGKDRLDPEASIPKENIWGRPLAAKLKRSKMKKWYKKTADRLMPPVERAEWDKLRLLATGRADRGLWEMPRRRPVGTLLFGQQDDTKTWDWRRYATEPVRSIERGSSRSFKARTGEEGEAPYGLGRPIGLHSYGRFRFWQRLYARVWAATPTMEKLEGKDSSKAPKWKIQWGATSREVADAAPSQAVFFEGAVAAMPKKTRGRY